MKTRLYTQSRCRLFVTFLSSISLLLFAQPSGKRVRPIEPVIHDIQTFITEGMQKTGVPGVAVAVVYRNEVVYLEGFGLREAGSEAKVDAGTVFQLASVSKPIASTIVAALVGNHEVDWDDRIIDLDRQFKLSDPDVTERLTI